MLDTTKSGRIDNKPSQDVSGYPAWRCGDRGGPVQYGPSVVSYCFMGLQDKVVPALQESLRDQVDLVDSNIYSHRPGFV
jgi:hypothetical protein